MKNSNSTNDENPVLTIFMNYHGNRLHKDFVNRLAFDKWYNSENPTDNPDIIEIIDISLHESLKKFINFLPENFDKICLTFAKTNKFKIYTSILYNLGEQLTNYYKETGIGNLDVQLLDNDFNIQLIKKFTKLQK